ncbi:MAG TPA: FoF1 ATP synthase subunit gamma [Methylomirabilota bacterium]|nr:FoF1 ATP synthase subunit gamma [Methylomirabilota bacterium]
MQAYKKITEEITINEQLKMLTQAYQEHAIVQINFARYSVISSREFMEELDEIFFNVKTSYQTYLEAIREKREAKTIRNLHKNGKDVLILLSSNGKFYGDLITKVCRLFAEQAKTTKADLVIVGKEGKKFFEQTGIKKPFAYFEIPDTNVTLNMLKPLIHQIIVYQKVSIFYGKFDNIIIQEPVESSLSGDMPNMQKDEEEKDKKANFLFEPTVEHIMEFFESQIFSLLLNQTVNEGKLARFASRVKAMELAQNNIQKQITFLTHRERRIKSMEMNKKQLQLFAGRRLWGKSR